ncbi:hypothetical protein [Cellulophaga fucicola]|uniref:Uncharacterized protein n=1 Tax=Cellulophaga fucicola TaxID=76595 RepID=A0A1K1QJG5_9FLAO|nr:hypothetical protein [Cellulophaga fucicola]SFW60088.1 hypothetical protein SAMN05660313_02706 [Cellulophaga fucicola]
MQNEPTSSITNDSLNISIQDSLFVQVKNLNENISSIHTDLHSHLNQKTDTFFGVSNDTIFTVVFTILIFALGILIDRLLKRNNEQKELQKLKDYFNNQFDDLKKNIVPELRNGYKKFYQETISLDNGVPTTAPKILTNTYDRLSNLESPLLFKTFKNSSDFNTAFSQIDFIKNLMVVVDDYHSIVVQRSETLKSVFVGLDKKYLDKVVEFTEYEKNNNPNYLQDPTFLLLDSKVQYYHQNIIGKRALTDYYKNIIRPIQAQIVSTNLFRTHPVGKEISVLGRDISHQYNHLRMLYIEIRSQYRYFTQVLNRTISKLESLNTE